VNRPTQQAVMPGLVPGIHAETLALSPGIGPKRPRDSQSLAPHAGVEDGDKPGHDV